MKRWTLICSVVALLALSFFGCSRYGGPSEMTRGPKHSALRMENDALVDELSITQGTFNSQVPATQPTRPRPFATASKALHAGEDLIIIERSVRNPNDDNLPGSGALVAKLPSEPSKNIPIPLKHTDVKASILGYISTVDVTQQFHNPYDTKIEVVYVFPLPTNAAVNEFLMTIGERRIRGIIREREEAQRIYQQAKAQGYTASLLTQERPNIFTQLVANIEPGKQIDVNIRYYHTLAYQDGWYEFAFPMVVGPRFNPPGTSDGIGAVGRGSRGVSGQSTEVQYLRPGERSGHDISLALDIDAGVAIESIKAINHTVNANVEGNRARVTLAREDAIPNKDFVLRFQVAGGQTKSAAFAHRDSRGGYFTLILYPPTDLTNLPRKPLEMVFTLDVSGSMSGKPIQQSKAAIRYALANMDSRDTFQVIRFFDRAERLFPQPRAATRENIEEARSFIEVMSADGGTMMMEGIRASLNFPHDESRLRLVSFLTDGYIGNEAEILREVHDNLGPSRIFSFGVGSSPNRYLLDHLAKMGNGVTAYLSLNDKAEDVMRPFFERIAHPALTNIQIDWGRLDVSEVYPPRMPDLFVGQPVILTGRFNGQGNGNIRLRGRLGDEQREYVVPLNLNKSTPTHAALPSIWARAKIAELGHRATWDGGIEVPRQVRQIALEYGLMSSFTAFVAVDSSNKTAGAHGVSVNVPVPVPDGVRYETTVQETPSR